MLFSPHWSSVSSPRLMKRSSAIENNCSSRNYCPEVAWPQRVALSQSCNTSDSLVFPPLMDGDSQCSRERARHNSWSVGHCCQMWVALGIFHGFCAKLAGWRLPGLLRFTCARDLLTRRIITSRHEVTFSLLRLHRSCIGAAKTNSICTASWGGESACWRDQFLMLRYKLITNPRIRSATLAALP